jgi:hypothetical protein
MIKPGYFLLLLFPVFVWVLSTFSVTDPGFARELNIKNSPTPSATPLIDIGEKVSEGISLLKSSPPLLFETKNGKPAGDLVRKQIALAIWNKNTGEVFEKRVWVREQEIKDYKKTGIINLDPVNLPTSDVGINVRVKWWNSFNTFYEVNPVKSSEAGAEQFDGVKNQPDLAVVANKYLLESRYLSSLPEKSKTKYTDIIYVPYSKSLHLPEVIVAGGRYLEDCIARAFEQLESAKVVSRSLPGSPVTAVVSREFVKSIILVEHIDPDSFNLAADGGQELTERVLAIIGANQEQAYRYTASPAGASGLAQFIKSTYNSIVSKYPEARLIKDYNLGMADHVNAVKAMVLFFDGYKKEIDNKVTRRDVIRQIGVTEEMLAAAYNGGANKVVRSVNKYGLAWISGQLNLPRDSAIFKKETVDYIKKFRSVKGLNLF